MGPKGFGEVRTYAPPLAEEAKIPADERIEDAVTLMREGVLKSTSRSKGLGHVA